ncbi:lambda exonuclease family protein [Paraburkholderia sp. C35]|uniref:lambda exonuclease family protein n=1 Tax=Paraburkholderia sp. C35 TaxID=2126993 RepID=UPI000D69491B|nr:lambda exonuclease family protein [Paraburkholderia sp. C35]
MIELACDQGTPEWHASRAGVITASMFSTARKFKASGESSETAKNYAFRLAIERISGVPLDEGHETWQMKRGQRLEPEARDHHMQDIGRRVRQVGLVLTDDRKFGASADGAIDNDPEGDGGSEYKCLVSPLELRRIYLDYDYGKFEDQVMGGLWITNKRWWDFCVYCPAMRAVNGHFVRWRVRRDENYIDTMVRDLLAFDNLVEEYRLKLVQRFQGDPAALAEAAALLDPLASGAY